MYPLILAFHKIIPDEYITHPYFWRALCTPYSHFLTFIESLYQENFAFIALQELEYAMMNPKERTVLLTFDDGYYNNIVYAYPLLKAENIPFVLALNGKCIQNCTWQWFDKVWYYSIKNQKPTVEIIAQIQHFKYDIPALETWLNSHTEMPHTPETRIFFDIASVAELKTLQNVSFVSHTYSHYVVTALSEVQLKQELTQNVDFFSKNNLKNENTYFVLPNGTKQDFNTQTLNTLTDFGVEYVLSMLPYTRDTRVVARYTPVHSTWQKEKQRYQWQRFLYKWLK